MMCSRRLCFLWAFYARCVPLWAVWADWLRCACLAVAPVLCCFDCFRVLVVLWFCAVVAVWVCVGARLLVLCATCTSRCGGCCVRCAALRSLFAGGLRSVHLSLFCCLCAPRCARLWCLCVRCARVPPPWPPMALSPAAVFHSLDLLRLSPAVAPLRFVDGHEPTVCPCDGQAKRVASHVCTQLGHSVCTCRGFR